MMKTKDQIGAALEKGQNKDETGVVSKSIVQEGSNNSDPKSKMDSKSDPEPKQGKRFNIKILLIGLVIVVVGLIIGVIVFVLWTNFQLNANKPLSAKAGGLELKYLPQINQTVLQKEKVGDVEIVYNPKLKQESKIIKQILENSALSDKEGQSRAVTIVLDPGLTVQGLEGKSEEYSLYQPDIFVTSGNHIFVPSDQLDIFNYPLRVYGNLQTGVDFARWFNDLEESDLQEFVDAEVKYDLEGVEIVSDYASIDKQDSEGDTSVNDNASDSASDGSADDSASEASASDEGNDAVGGGSSIGRILLAERIKSYAEYTPVCRQIEKIEEVLACELFLYQSGKADEVADVYKQFISQNFDLDEHSAFRAIGVAYPGQLDELVKELGLVKSALEYDAWAIDNFSDADYILADGSSYYQKVSDPKLDELKELIEADGWTFEGESEKKKDSQFEGEQRALTFSKESDLNRRQLRVLVMDTRGLNADCIIEGVGQVYCDDDSLYKNSDNYIRMLVGYKAKYSGS